MPKRSSISKKTLFPNLTSRPIDLIDPPSVDSDPKPVHPDSKPAKRRLSKRQADVDGSDSESRSSSRLSKRRKYSTEPSESFTILPTDSAASLRLLESFKLSGLFFHPDAIAKAKEDWRNMASAYESEKASRRETFEAALRRATRRANEAEHKLQDASQEYADKLKLEKEVQGKVLEAKEKELQAEKDKNKGSESLGDMTAQLSEKEEQLKLYDALRSQINTQVEQLKTLEVTALESSESIKNQHSVLTGYIDKFADEDWDDMGVGRLMGTVKKSGREIQDSNLTLIEKLEEVRGTWRRMSEAVSAFHAQFGAETSRSMDTSDWMRSKVWKEYLGPKVESHGCEIKTLPWSLRNPLSIKEFWIINLWEGISQMTAIKTTSLSDWTQDKSWKCQNLSRSDSSQTQHS